MTKLDGNIGDFEVQKFLRTLANEIAIRTIDGNTAAVDSNNSTSTALNNGESYTGDWVERVTPEIIIAIATDQDCTYKTEFSVDGTNVDSTLTFTYEAGVVEQPKRLVVARRYYRVSVTNNSGSNQTYLRLQTSAGQFRELNSPLNGIITEDHGAMTTRTLNFEDELVFGKYVGYNLVQIFGENVDIDATGNEDVWDGGGTYTGFPTGSPEELVIVLSSAADVGGKLTIKYIAASTDTSWTTTEITTTGTTTNTGITAYRCVRGVWDGTTSATPGVNAGTITVRHITTTTNIFMVIPIGKGQSRVCCDRILTGNVASVKKIFVHVNKNNTANVDGSLWVREEGKTFRLIRPFTATDSLDHEDPIFGGLLLEGPLDFAIRIETCSANNTDVTAGIDYFYRKA